MCLKVFLEQIDKKLVQIHYVRVITNFNMVSQNVKFIISLFQLNWENYSINEILKCKEQMIKKCLLQSFKLA